MGVQIVYTSRTGNTEKLAEAVFAAVPVKEKNVKLFKIYIINILSPKLKKRYFSSIAS